MPACPNCTSARSVKNSRIHPGKQRFKCIECKRQFVEQPTKKVIDSATQEFVDQFLGSQCSRFIIKATSSRWSGNGQDQLY